MYFDQDDLRYQESVARNLHDIFGCDKETAVVLLAAMKVLVERGKVTLTKKSGTTSPQEKFAAALAVLKAAGLEVKVNGKLF